MNAKFFPIPLAAVALASWALGGGGSAARAAIAHEACALLTQSTVSSALGVDVDPGGRIAPEDPRTCLWRAKGHPTGIAANVIVYLIDDQAFEQMKERVSRNPAALHSGIGDEAFTFRPRMAPEALIVRKGTQYFQVMARTVAAPSGSAPPGGSAAAAPDQAAAIEKTLALEILKKL